jgi:hypothetical protein
MFQVILKYMILLKHNHSQPKYCSCKPFLHTKENGEINNCTKQEF